MARGAGKLGEFRVDVKESIPVGVQFLELFATALREDKVARVAITRCDRLFAIGGFVIAIMTAETNLHP